MFCCITINEQIWIVAQKAVTLSRFTWANRNQAACLLHTNLFNPTALAIYSVYNSYQLAGGNACV